MMSDKDRDSVEIPDGWDKTEDELTDVERAYLNLHADRGGHTEPQYPTPVGKQTALPEVIKIRWSQSQATHVKMVHSLTASFEDANADEPLIGSGVRALTRQKTNVVVKTVEEAESLLYELAQYIHPYGLNVPDGAGTRTYERVRDELETELERRGFTVEWGEHRPNVVREGREF